MTVDKSKANKAFNFPLSQHITKGTVQKWKNITNETQRISNMFNFTNLYECSKCVLCICSVISPSSSNNYFTIGAQFLTCGNLPFSLSNCSDVYINKVTKLKPSEAGWLLAARY